MHLRVGSEIICIVLIFTTDIKPHFNAYPDPLHRGGIDVIADQRPGIARRPGKHRVNLPLAIEHKRLRVIHFPGIVQHRTRGIISGVDQYFFRQVSHRDIAIIFPLT